jgi:putative ABC transport system permease protein
MLARASGRQQEFSVRAALGASRARLAFQLLTESVVVALAGGVLGIGLAYLGTWALVAAQPADIPRLDEIGVNGGVVAFTLGLAALTGVVFGVYPALHASRRTASSALRESTRGGGASRAGHRSRAVLVVVETALAVVLLMGAGLLIRSFAALTSVDRGFDTDRGLTFGLLMQGPSYQRGEQVRPRVAEFEARLRAIPGVTAVGVGTVVPLGSRGSMLDFAVVDAPPPPASVNAEIAVGSVSPEYFKAIGSPLRRGRAFTERDTAESPLVALVNEAAVRQWFGGDPIGRFVITGGQRREIVGVVGDVRQRGLRQPAAPQLFTPFTQRTSRSPRFFVRTAGDPMALTPALRAAIRGVDPQVAIQPFVPFTDLVANSVARPRFYASLLTLFAAVALALAATGIFGVMNYAVAQRSHEISVRMALGARAGSVLRMIVGRAVLLAAVGNALGVAGALGLGRLIEGQLFGVTRYDAVTFFGVALVLVIIAAAASALPARRAASVDPANALRQA